MIFCLIELNEETIKFVLLHAGMVFRECTEFMLLLIFTLMSGVFCYFCCLDFYLACFSFRRAIGADNCLLDTVPLALIERIATMRFFTIARANI